MTSYTPSNVYLTILQLLSFPSYKKYIYSVNAKKSLPSTNLKLYQNIRVRILPQDSLSNLQVSYF